MELDTTFLEDIGLAGLGSTEQEKLLGQFREALELRISTRIVEGLSDEQLQEFEALAPDDDDEDNVAQQKQEQAFAWLQRTQPDYVAVVNEEVELLKQDIIARSDDVIATLS